MDIRRTFTVYKVYGLIISGEIVEDDDTKFHIWNTLSYIVYL